MTKPLHVGRAAQNGVMAAELAARGFTGGKDALDGAVGLLPGRSATAAASTRTASSASSASRTAICQPGVSIKPYPCGVLGHPTHGCDAAAGDRARRQARADRGDPRCAPGSNILNPLRYPIAHERARGEVLPGVHVSARSRCAAKPASTSSPTSSCRARRCRQMMREGRARARPGDRGARASRRSAAPSRSISRTARTLVEHADERYRGGPDLPFTRDELHEKFGATARRSCCRQSGIDEALSSSSTASRRLADVATLVRRARLAGARQR